MSDPAPAFHARLALALRLAMRDLRGGLSGFGVLIACIAIGVAAIVAVSSLARGLGDGLAREGRIILGGDVSFSLLQREANPDEEAYLRGLGAVQVNAFLRAMTRAEDGGATLAELKAVGSNYPAYGTLQTSPQADASHLLQQRDGLFGVVVDPLLSGRLGLKVGDRLMIGSLGFEIRAEILREPDRVATGVGFGPRVIVSHEGLRASGLLQPGSLVRWSYRVSLPDGGQAASGRLASVVDAARARFPDAGWDIRTRENAAPQLSRNLERFTQFLTLVGLTALAVGGVGVANAARAFADRKRGAMAVLKSLGAEGRLIFKLLLIEVLCLGAIGAAIGVMAGIGAPYLVKVLAASVLPFPLVTGIYLQEVAVGFAYGMLTVAAFAIWPLGRAHDIPVSALFRDLVSEDRRWPRPGYLLLVSVATAMLIGVAVLFAWDRTIALIYIAAAAATFLILRLVAIAIMALARRMPSPRRTEVRLALVNLHKPGALTPSVVLSLGLGVTLLVALGLIDHNLRNQLARALPEKAPSFFFLDIPAAETSAFEAMIASRIPDGRLERVPMMRGRVVALKGVRSEQIKAHERAEWVLRGDRGITFAQDLPKGSVLVEGTWWEKDYKGPALVSFDHELAGWLGLSLGDEVTVNVLGRTFSARIANLRKVEWQSLGINFVLVFSPSTFAGAPYSNLATLTLPKGGSEAAEIGLLKAAAREFPAVSSVRVKEALEAIDTVVAQLAVAVRGASSVAVIASIIVLGGALAAGRRTRAQESVILKTLGATRGRLLAAMIVEYAMLGLAASLFGVAAGALAGYAIVTQVMNLTFSFPWASMLGLSFTALSLVIILGLAGTWRILGQKPAAYLRNA